MNMASDPKVKPKCSRKDRNPIILIVEDSQPMRVALTDLMELSFPSSFILQAESAEQALEMAASQPPDLVLMDIVLPGMDGLTCLNQIRSISPKTQSVVLSYHEDQPYQKKAKQAGASAFVAKRRIYLDLMPAVESILKTENPVDQSREKEEDEKKAPAK